MKNTILILIIILNILNFVYTQELYSPVTHTQGWVNIGVGYGQLKLKQSYSGLISFSYAHKGKMLTFRYIYSETEIFEMFESTNILRYFINEFSILYGLLDKHRFRFVSLGVGLGYVTGEERYRYQSFNIREIGLSIETQAFLTLPGLGIGLYGFGNINRKWITYGMMLSLQMGKLR